MLYIIKYKSKNFHWQVSQIFFYRGSGVTLKVLTDTIIWWKFQWKACEGGLLSEGIDSAGRSLSPLGHWFNRGPAWLWPGAVTAGQLLSDLRGTSGSKPAHVGWCPSPWNKQLQQISAASTWGASSSLRNCMDVVPRGTDSKQGLPYVHILVWKDSHILHFIRLDALAQWGCFPVKQLLP